MIRVLGPFATMCLSLIGCTSQHSSNDDSEATKVSADTIHVEFLTRDGCANTPVLLANLETAMESFESVTYEIVNQETLPVNDVRIGYATPTILYDNRDLFGLPTPEPPFAAPS